jgi:DMATS type aromatic prenyltransferase
MEEAGYDIETQYHVLAFHRRYIIPRLGPVRQSKETSMKWRSLMTDDFSPMEYSWNWETSKSAPNIRYSIEAIGQLAGSKADPVNQTSSLELCQEIAKYSPKTDWTLFQTLKDALYDKNVSVPENNVENPERSSSTSIMMAFELGSSIATKAYFFPLKAEQHGISRLDLLKETMNQLRSDTIPLGGFDELLQFMQTPQGLKLDIICMAIDCVSPEQSRYKIYLRSPETSFERVCDMMSLGGRTGALTGVARQNLKDIWRLTLGLDKDFDENIELPSETHETAGVLYYFDIKAGNEMPKPKLYVPVRHYAQNDLAVAQGLGEYLHSRKLDKYFPNYMRALESSCDHRQLNEGTGFQTYLGVGIEKDGSLTLCSYLNGEVYHPRRWS